MTSTGQTQFSHISETALWVAYYRAMETNREDALFKDPYAELLAGEKGRDYVHNMKGGKSSAWSMIVRTKVVDDMIQDAIPREGIDTIINLAAGLDTRPYRLEIPPDIIWIEADLPGIISYKEEKLSAAKPNCRLERVNIDLKERENRNNLFERINRTSRHALVISEGLLVYLEESEVATLAVDLHAQPAFQRDHFSKLDTYIALLKKQ